ncbi:MAG: hypothetical protein KAT68_18350 [Bacteroidales bacterium]|nr:hypothetical protein [Bacteroidales bacterium]
MINAIYNIGKALIRKQEPIDSLLKDIDVEKIKEQKDGTEIKIKNYVLRIIFNLDESKVEIDKKNLISFDDKSVKEFLYCGNNGRMEKQFYLTREMKSAKYIFGKTFSDLLEKAKKEDPKYSGNELYVSVKKIVDSDFYDDKKKQLNFEKIEGFNKDLKNLSENQLINKLCDIKRNEKIIIITPTIIFKDKEETIKQNLVELPEYKELILSKFKQKKNDRTNKNDYCYLCKENKQSSYKNLSEIFMKLFTSTTINSASYFTKKFYDKNFRICTDCLIKLKTAEKYIKNNLSLSIAGTPTYLIPEIIDFNEEINPDFFSKLHYKIEMAFNDEKFESFIESIELNTIKGLDRKFSLSFLSYETDGNYFKIINEVHSVPEFYFCELSKILAENYIKYHQEIKGEYRKGFSLGSIYHLIPIKYKTDGSRSDTKNRTLQFYSQLFSENKIDKNILLSYFCEAMYHLFMNQQKVYKNLYYYKENNFDFAIKDYFYQYLVLLNTLEDLKLINKEDYSMENEKIIVSEEIEKFLSENKFNEQQKALFYLGILINKVAKAQVIKKHYNKPILNKISYQGMNFNDLKRLYVDVFEKLHQYSKELSYDYEEIDNVNSLCKKYFDKNDTKWKLTEFANVFYLLSGFAYKVANLQKN